MDICALAAADRVPGKRGASLSPLPPPPPPPPLPLSRPLRTLPLEMRAEVGEEGRVVGGQAGAMVEEGMVVVQGEGEVVVMQQGGVRGGQTGVGEQEGEKEEDEGLVQPEKKSAGGEGSKREWVQPSARRQEAVDIGLEGAGVGAKGADWCTRAAKARACEEEPLLAEAFRQFEEKHPGATIMQVGCVCLCFPRENRAHVGQMTT